MKKVWIKTKYDDYYKLINKIKDIICIYDVKKVDGKYLLILVSLDDYEKLQKYIVSYKFELVENSGFYFILGVLKKNRLLFITSLIGLGLFFFINNFIVEVEVLHEDSKIRELLYDELDEYGLTVLSIKKSYDEITEIKDAILNKYEDSIDWLEIEVIGMKYTVRAEERIITELESDEDYCNVYATKGGVITSISVQKGVSVVSIGDYVSEGDLLITGDILLGEEVVDEVCASGVVKAESWYEANVIVPFEYFEIIETGLSKYNFIFSYDNNEYRLLNDRVEEYISDKTLLFDLFGYQLYLENQIEVEKNYFYYDEDEAFDKALLLSEENMLLKLDEKDSIIDQKVLKKTVNDSTIEVDIFIITEEVIS